MIRIQKLGKTNYYVDMEDQYTKPKDYEDYLNKNNHIPAQFVGGFIEKLPYSRDSYNALMAGKSPKTFNNLTEKETKNAGYDIVIALPKSYSMLYSAADETTREKLNQIQQEVTKQYLADATKLIRPAGSRNEYSDYDPDKTKTIAAEFWHIENRDLEPHLHAHINLFNAAEFTMANGEKKTFAINAQEMYYHQKEMNAELNNRLCGRLNEIGFKTIGTANGFRVVGITAEQEKMFSGRRSEILDFIEEKKQQGKFFSSQVEAEAAKLKEQIRDASKNQKPDMNHRQILEYQQKQLAERGITLDTIMEHQRDYEYNPPEIIEQAIIRDATALAGIVSETELRRQILDINRDLTPDKQIHFNDFCRRNELVTIDLGNGHQGFTTNEIIITEMQNIEQAKKLAVGEYGRLNLDENAEKIKNEALKNLQSKFKMNDGQSAACELIAKNERIALIEGDAGTGKTTTAIKFTNDYYSAQGYEVVGLATQGKTSNALQEAGIENTQNLSEFFIKEPSGSRRILVVDEAGMTGAEQYRQLLRYAENNHDTKLVFVGDQKQLSSVAYGTSFENIRENLTDSHQARLWENKRQSTEQQRAIAEAARDRNPTKMLEHLITAGGLHETQTREAAIQKLAHDYVVSDKTKIALAHTNNDVNAINDAIRQELASQDKLDMGKQVEFTVGTGKTTENRSFTEGDQIILTGKYKKQGIEIIDVAGQPREVRNKLTIENGTEATIKKIEGNNITLTTKNDNQTYVIDTKEFNKFNHAYCVTTHKSQGVTVDESFVYANGNENANRNYVNMSRHKEVANLYIAEENKERFIERAALNEDKLNITQDKTCRERYEYLIEHRQNLLLDPHDTKNQIADLQEQISLTGDSPDIEQRLDQMQRLDGILDDLNGKHGKVLEQKTLYEKWKKEKSAARGNWKRPKKVKTTVYEKESLEKQQSIENQIQTAEDIKAKLKADIQKMREEQYVKPDKSKEDIIMELKGQGNQKLEDIQKQIALNELEEIKQGRHIMTPDEANKRYEQIEQLSKIPGKEAEETIKTLHTQIVEGTRQTRSQEPPTREEILEEMQAKLEHKKTFEIQQAQEKERSRTQEPSRGR